ncbi:hypothetical protein LOTGIDRAFT_230973 [Lottia gigantea]|uniref:Cyclic nucleotide-binding domain-containing protein n=1 Tax=Lottia gigantea TaxID=225164 RepID=V4AY95_LOTGI|nr:hypothetical protein LOTGIDRAFT_230973 [Lottia gigantea]ESP00016.1 hypothetical protein LOTGIDRAFT_230973 [Lottia gigantea]
MANGKEKRANGLELLRLSAGKIIQSIAMEKEKDLNLNNKSDKLFHLTAHLMRERNSVFLPKFGIFANLEERLRPARDETGRDLQPVDLKVLRRKRSRDNVAQRRDSVGSRSRKMSGDTSGDEGIVDIFREVDGNKRSLRSRAAKIVHAALWTNNRRDSSTSLHSEQSKPSLKRRPSVSQIPENMNSIDKIAFLRKNVHFIEKKFKAIAQKQRHVSGNGDDNVPNNGMDLMPDIAEYRPSRFEEPGSATKLFKKYASIIIIIHQWFQLLLNNNKCNWEKELKTFVDLAVNIEENSTPELMKKSGLSFDKSYFKTNKEISLSAEVRKTLTTRPSARNPDMLKQVLLGLQSLHSLGEYPVKTQENICQVAWYQKVPSKKAIIRQGHISENFYFVLSGTAFVKKIVEDPGNGDPVSTTVAKLVKGQSFGEVGLIFNSKRTATVETATEMEMLVIEKSDFYQIFMNMDNPEGEPSHISFLRQQPLMKYWPIDILREEPSACFLHYFKRGALVSENGKTSDWIYFIKSGTCEVIKSLRAVKPQVKKDKKADIMLPEFLAGRSMPMIDSGVRRSRRSTVDSEVFDAMENYYSDVHNQVVSVKTLHLPNINNNKQVQIMITSPRDQNEKEEENMAVFHLPVAKPTRLSGSAGVSRSKFDSKYSRVSESHSQIPRPSSLKKTIRPKSTPAVLKSERSEEENIFVKVELLQAKDVFGANTLKFVDHEESNIPSVSLVSKGAEIVMLSKRMFLKYADEQVRNHVQTKIRYYPMDATLQENLQTKVNWEQYRQTVLQDTLHNHRKLRFMSGYV